MKVGERWVHKAGGGRVVRKGDQVSLHYLVSTSEEKLDHGVSFESSYDGGAPYTFCVGDGRLKGVIDQALLGMRVGSTLRVAVETESPIQGVLSAPIPAGQMVIVEIFIKDAIAIDPGTTLDAWFEAIKVSVGPESSPSVATLARSAPIVAFANRRELAMVQARLDELDGLLKKMISERNVQEEVLPSAKEMLHNSRAALGQCIQLGDRWKSIKKRRGPRDELRSLVREINALAVSSCPGGWDAIELDLDLDVEGK